MSLLRSPEVTVECCSNCNTDIVFLLPTDETLEFYERCTSCGKNMCHFCTKKANEQFEKCATVFPITDPNTNPLVYNGNVVPSGNNRIICRYCHDNQLAPSSFDWLLKEKSERPKKARKMPITKRETNKSPTKKRINSK